MTIHSLVHAFARCTLAALVVVGLSACDRLIYDDEGDCSVSYKVRFVDDYNLLGADAFDSEVTRVTLYAIDAEGTVVWQGTATHGEIQSNGGYMTLPLEAGDYELVAWAEGSLGAGVASWLPLADSGTGRLSRRLALTGDHAIDCGIDHLFHGRIHVSLPAEEDPVTYNREYVYPMRLCKNTNSVTVLVQQVDGSLVDPHDFEFSLVADNTHYDEHNNIVRQGNTIYHAWSTRYGTAEIDTRAENMPTVVAEMSTGRLVAGDDVRVVVTNKATGRQMLSFPLIDYLLMVRSQYISSMPDQEYLDRQYGCSIVFFLDESKTEPELKGKYLDVTIGVLSWRIVLQSTDL